MAVSSAEWADQLRAVSAGRFRRGTPKHLKPRYTRITLCGKSARSMYQHTPWTTSDSALPASECTLGQRSIRFATCLDCLAELARRRLLYDYAQDREG